MSIARAAKRSPVGVVVVALLAGGFTGCDLVQLQHYQNFDDWYADIGIADDRLQSLSSGLSDETCLGSIVNYDLLRTPVFAAYEAARTVLIPAPAVYYAIAGDADNGPHRRPGISMDPGWSERADEAKLIVPQPPADPEAAEADPATTDAATDASTASEDGSSGSS